MATIKITHHCCGTKREQQVMVVNHYLFETLRETFRTTHYHQHGMGIGHPVGPDGEKTTGCVYDGQVVISEEVSL